MEDIEDISWDEWAASKRVDIFCMLLSIASLLFGLWAVGDLLGQAQTMLIDELPVETGTLDGVRREYIEEGSWWRRWTEEVTIAEIDGVEYEVNGAFMDVSGLSTGEKVEFRVRDGKIVEVGEDLDGAREESSYEEKES